MDEFETFCRHKALEKAILDSTDLLEQKDYGSVEAMIKEASPVGLVSDFGLDYYENPKERLQWIRKDLQVRLVQAGKSLISKVIWRT